MQELPQTVSILSQDFSRGLRSCVIALGKDWGAVMKYWLWTLAWLCVMPFGAMAQEVDCDGDTTIALNECYAEALHEADAALNDEYGRLRQIAINWDEFNADPLNSAEDLLVMAQRAWIQFRDADCAFDSFVYEGGSIQSMITAQCLIRHTEQRREALEVLAQTYSEQ